MIKYKFIKTSDPDYPQGRALRWEMLHKPLGLPPGAEYCPEDAQGLHLIALEKNEVIGCILFYPDSNKSGRIVQMATADLDDHQGFVRKFLHQLEDHLTKQGFKEIECVVKDERLDFFERLGFHNLGHKNVLDKDCFVLHKALYENE